MKSSPLHELLVYITVYTIGRLVGRNPEQNLHRPSYRLMLILQSVVRLSYRWSALCRCLSNRSLTYFLPPPLCHKHMARCFGSWGWCRDFPCFSQRGKAYASQTLSAVQVRGVQLTMHKFIFGELHEEKIIIRLQQNLQKSTNQYWLKYLNTVVETITHIHYSIVIYC